jgi:methylglyoxal synthase
MEEKWLYWANKLSLIAAGGTGNKHQRIHRCRKVSANKGPVGGNIKCDAGVSKKK